MGKHGKHQKQVKSEKAKVKLKVKGEKTKFLPKGLNVTNTDFKIKPIVIREQLKLNAESEPSTTRKLNFQDLSSRLNHYNTTVKFEACQGLYELISLSPEFLNHNLSSILHGICQLLRIKDDKPRREAIKVINGILEKVPEQDMAPFFNLLSSHLKCAMTDIDKNVQEDSLLLMDSLIKHTPSLVSQASYKILPSFFALISKLRSDSSSGRTLTLNLGSKMTSVKWRIKVLSRLEDVLKAIVDEKDEEDENNMGISLTSSKTETSGVVLYAEESNTIPIYAKNIYLQDCPVDHFSNCNMETETDDKNCPSKYTGILIPLLYETWLEVAPDIIHHDDTSLKPETAVILRCILKIFYLLCQYIKAKENEITSIDMKHVFLSKEGEALLNNLLRHFPYCQLDAKMHKSESIKRSLKPQSDTKCVQQNLLICYIFSIFNKTLLPHSVNYAQNIVKYVKKCLMMRNYVKDRYVKTLIQVLRVILLQNLETWSKKGVNIGDLADGVLHFYRNTLISDEKKDQIFYIICEVTCCEHLNTSESYLSWLRSLPSLLCEEQITKRALDSLRLFLRHSKLFQNIFLQKLPDILANLHRIKVVELDKSNKLNRYPHLSLISLFYNLPNFQKDQADLFVKFLSTCGDNMLRASVKELLSFKASSKV